MLLCALHGGLANGLAAWMRQEFVSCQDPKIIDQEGGTCILCNNVRYSIPDHHLRSVRRK